MGPAGWAVARSGSRRGLTIGLTDDGVPAVLRRWRQVPAISAVTNGPEDCMLHLQSRIVGLLSSLVLLGSVCYGATITGTVKGADGAPFEGAFVKAHNTQTKIDVIALTDRRGHFRIEGLSPGNYQVQAWAIGYLSAPRNGVSLTAPQNASFDFELRKEMVRWNELSLYQAEQLWPPAKGKDLILSHCNICHGFETRMASVTRDEVGWTRSVRLMRETMRFSFYLGPHFNDQDAADVASYLTSLFGPESILPKSPASMPKYKETVRPFSSAAMNIVYVEYEMSGPSLMPFSAAPDKDGNLWIPNHGAANSITRLNPRTGEMQDFKVPHVGSAGVHSAVPAPDGSVWLAEQGSNKLGRWDPATQQITEYQDPYLPGKEGIEDGGQKHTLRLDSSGKVWTSGRPLTRFDPETKKFNRFDEVETCYDVKVDKADNVWFTSPAVNRIGKVDGKTMKVSQWTLPTPGAAPRRLEIGPDGMIWTGEFRGGKMARFDPRTETFTEYPLPGPDPSPYGLGFDADGYLWYDSHDMDLLGRFDPRTGKVIEYPFPHAEITMREFFRDEQGRMWFGTSANNKVGYFFLVDKTGSARSVTK